MGKFIYKLEVSYTNSKAIKVSSEIQRMGPDELPMGNSSWNTDDWDENGKSKKLVRAIGDKKKMGFVLDNYANNEYWRYQFKNEKIIEHLTLKVSGEGVTKKINIFEAQLVPYSTIPMAVNGKWFCTGYTLKFNDSDIDSGWSLFN